MLNKTFKAFCTFLMMSSAVSQAAADGSSFSKIFKKDRWSLSLDSIHYNLEGEEPARGNIYSFKDVTSDIQLANLTFQYSPTLNFSVLSKYVNTYAETFFGPDLYFDRTRGVGDLQLKISQTNFKKNTLFISDAAVSIPLGSIREKNPYAPPGIDLNYPYNMQLGSGTYDLILNQTAIKTLKGKHQFGGFASGTFRFGTSSEGYRRGNEAIVKAWYSYILTPHIVPGVWANFYHQQGISGQDRTFGRNQFVEFYHNSRQFWDITPHINFNYSLTKKVLIRAMVGRPLWQIGENIDDVQVFTQWFSQLGLDVKF